MLARTYQPVRQILRRSDLFGVKPILSIKDRDKRWSLTLIASLVFYVLAALLIHQEISNFIDQAEWSSFSTALTDKRAVTWRSESDINISVEVSVGGMEGPTNTRLLGFYASNRGVITQLEEKTHANKRTFTLPLGTEVYTQGWNRTDSHFEQFALRANCSTGEGSACQDIPFRLVVEVKSFDQHSQVSIVKRAIYEKSKPNTKLVLELAPVVSSTDISSSPYDNITTVLGVNLNETHAHIEPAEQAPEEVACLQLGRLVHLFTFASFKYHRYVSNIGNFLTTLHIMVLMLFFEFNQLNKYVRACSQLYVVKYLDNQNNLVLEEIKPSVWDFLLPLRKAFGCCSVPDLLKLKAVAQLRKETDIELIIKQTVNLERTLDELTANQVNSHLIDTFFPRQIEPPIISTIMLEPPILSNELTEPPIVRELEPPIIPSLQPPIIPEPSTAIKIKKVRFAELESEPEEPNPPLTEALEVELAKSKYSGVSLPSTVHTDNSDPLTASAQLPSLPSSNESLSSKKVHDFLRLSKVSNENLKGVADAMNTSIEQVMRQVCSKETLSQLTQQKSQPTALNQSLGTSVSQMIPELELRAIEPTVEKRKRLRKFFRKTLHDLLARLDFFSYSINFQVDANRPKSSSEVGGLCVLAAFWFALTVMLLDVVSFVKVDHQISRYDYFAGANSSLSIKGMQMFLFAHNLNEDKTASFKNLENYTTAEVTAPGYSLYTTKYMPLKLSQLDQATIRQLLKQPFLRDDISNIELGYSFALPQAITVDAAKPLTLEISFECARKICEELFSGIVLQLLVTSQKLDLTTQQFVPELQRYPLEYSFRHDLTLLRKRILLAKLMLSADNTVLPVKRNIKYFGYQLSATATESRQPASQDKGRKISVEFGLSDRVIEYDKSTVKLDEFVGNVEGVLVFVLCGVAIINIYCNGKKLQYSCGIIFRADKQGFSFKRMLKEMAFPWKRCKTDPGSLSAITEAGEQAMDLNKLAHRIRRLQNYSELPFKNQLERDFLRVYLKEPQETLKQDVPYQRTTSTVLALSEIGSTILQSQCQPTSFKDVVVRESRQELSSHCCRCIWDRLSRLDMFGQPVKLNFRGRSKYSSGITQMLSLLLLIALFAMFSFYLQEYVSSGNISIQKSVSTTDDFSINNQYSSTIELKVGLRDVRSHQVKSQYLSQLLEVADLSLYISDRLFAYSTAADPSTNLTTIRINTFQFDGKLNRSLLRLQFTQRRLLDTQLELELQRLLVTTDMQLCLSNFHFSPAKQTQKEGTHPVTSTLDCTEFFSLPLRTNLRRVTPVQIVEVHKQKYWLGLVQSSFDYRFYNYDKDSYRNSFSSSRGTWWNCTLEWQMDGSTALYQMVPSSLDAVVNKLAGALSLFICLLLVLTRVNKTRFTLELGCSLYQHSVGKVTFMDATKVLLARQLPACCIQRWWSARLNQLIRLYSKAAQQLSFRTFLRRINTLERAVYRGMSLQQRSQLNLSVRKEVTDQKNINPQLHRSQRLMKRHLRSIPIYPTLSQKLSLSDGNLLAVLPALAQSQPSSAFATQRKLRQLRSLLP